MASAVINIAYNELKEYLTEQPNLVNVSLVIYPDDPKRNHFRVINLAPVVVTLKRCEFSKSQKKAEQKKAEASNGFNIPYLCHPSNTTDPSGKPVQNVIPMTEAGIFLYTIRVYYFLCRNSQFVSFLEKEQINDLSKADLSVHLEYEVPKVVRVKKDHKIVVVQAFPEFDQVLERNP